MMRACSKCGVSKPLEDFYKHPMAASGRDTACKECRKSAVRANRQARIEYYRSYDRLRANEPHRVQARIQYQNDNRPSRKEPDEAKRKARVIIGNSLRSGSISKPTECEVCNASEHLHGHHESYDDPLSVIWVCKPCHTFIHKYWRAKKRLSA